MAFKTFSVILMDRDMDVRMRLKQATSSVPSFGILDVMLLCGTCTELIGQRGHMDQITLVLALMGLNPDHVAGTLRRGNIRGLRDCTSLMNPVVRYLKQNIDVPAKLEVVADDTKLRVLLNAVVQEVVLPQPVTLFLKRFHLGEFPELEV